MLNLTAPYFEFLLESPELLEHTQIQTTPAKLHLGETMAVFCLQKK